VIECNIYQRIAVARARVLMPAHAARGAARCIASGLAQNRRRTRRAAWRPPRRTPAARLRCTHGLGRWLIFGRGGFSVNHDR
jgi:hypothetical protein